MATTRLNRRTAKGRRDYGQFVAVPGVLLNHENFLKLSPYAVKLLMDLCAQYRGHNNGDLSCPFSMMQERGWKSRGTLGKALTQLLDSGFIEKTRQGGKHRCNLFALGWHPIDECGGKLDVVSSTIAPNRWKTPWTGPSK